MVRKLKDVVTNINVSNVENGFIGANFYTEDDGSAYIRITIKDKNEILDFTKTNMIPRLDLFAQDGSIFTDEPLDILYPRKGVIQYKVRDNVIQHVGKMDAKLFLANDKDSIHVANFYFTITDSGMTGPIGKEVHVDSLQYLVERVMKENAMGLLDDSFKEKLETDLKSYVNENPDKFKGSKGEPGKDGNVSFDSLTDAQKKDLAAFSDIEDKAVSYPRTDFLFSGKNIFNAYTITSDIILNYADGQEIKNETYVTSDFLPIEPNTNYTQNYADVVVFYDINKKFLSGLSRSATPSQARTFKTPSNAFFLRTTTIKDPKYAGYNYLNYQIEKGSTKTSFEKFNYSLPGLNQNIPSRYVSNEMLYDYSIAADKLSFTKRSENIFDNSRVTTGKYVNQTNGLLSDNINYSASDYIYIKDASTLSKNNNFATYAFYNKSFDFIPITTTATTQITVPQDAWYVRFSMLTSAINSTMLVKSDKVPESYIPYEIKIPSKFIEKEATQDKTDYNIDSFNKHTLKTYTSDISKQLNADYAGKTEIAFIGDSWVQGGEFRGGDRLTLPLKEKFMKLGYADGGIGFIGLANNHTGNGLLSVELKGSWTQYDANLDIGPKAKGLDTAMVESSTAGDSIVVTFYEEIDYYELHTSNIGKWRYKVDNGEWTTVDATQQEVTPIKLDLGKHTITLEVVEGLVSFIGSYAYKDNKGVVIHKMGNGGLKSSQIAATDRDNWVKQIKRCNANTFGILLGTNDMAASMTIADFEKNMKEIVSRIKEGKPLASVFLISPSGNNVQNTALGMSEYSNALHRVAKDLEIGFISLYRALGDFNITNSNGLMYKDGVHPNKNGGYAISNVVYDRLLRI
ncbi:BppU family phage baseplate upper protein [Staphylococcus lugdunensis]|uniref:BppU family phage baseplate upper protein n=1 Tax=Staphylococcus lugdunensis TaxID=28035 RepID=UPI001F58136E|nr:BppU family phage baseplate upper protein [Staphylococcus lugdunensis]MCI2760211.1 BppU family phage baseplate upper protein [Staphylococcus lugdunensis]MCI2794725.1 BppU family phage baseplate upper protein [Staphylococcus lugdunensis]MCI2797048.1 BppU family phage baseplate upper protein [Staphylococcus lugdunensis]